MLGVFKSATCYLLVELRQGDIKRFELDEGKVRERCVSFGSQ